MAWPQHCCTLSLFESWVTSCIAELAGVICTVMDDTTLITAEASSHLVLGIMKPGWGFVWVGTADSMDGSWPREGTVSTLALELMEEGSEKTGLQLAEVSTLSLEVSVPFMLKIKKGVDLDRLSGFSVVIRINTLLKMLSLTCVRQPVLNGLEVTSPFFIFFFLMLSWKESGRDDLKIKSPLIYFDYWT